MARRTVRTLGRRELILAGLSASLPGCKKEPEVLPGSGVEAKRSERVPAFTRVRAGGPFQVELTIGNPGELELSGDDNVLPLARARLEGSTLVFELSRRCKVKRPLRAKLSTPRLDGATVKGGASVSVSGLKQDSFELLGQDAGTAALRGAVQRLNVKTERAARVDLKELAVAEATVEANDISRVSFGYVEKLDATTKLRAVVTYQGEPKVTSKTEGASRVIAAR